MTKTLLVGRKKSDEEDSRIGQVIDRYRLVRRIGSGGMGTVYEAVHVHLGRRYALKILHPQLASNAQLAARFVAEGPTSNQPAVPGVVAVHHVGRAEDGSIFIVMEYLDGETLMARINRCFEIPDDATQSEARLVVHCVPSEEYVTSSLRLARQLAATLALVHKSGVVHRDLKPDNIFIICDPEAVGGLRAKILDFGIAKNVEQNAQQHGTLSWAPTLQPTAMGIVLGTPAYMAPEQWRDDSHADARSDVYSFGAILYEMLSGRLPFVASSVGELMQQHASGEPVPLSQIARWAPPGLSELVAQMMRKQPADRPTMAAVAAQLADIWIAQLRAQRKGLWTILEGSDEAQESIAVARRMQRRSDAIGEVVSPPAALRSWFSKTRLAGAGSALTLLIGVVALYFGTRPPTVPESAAPSLVALRANAPDVKIYGVVRNLDEEADYEQLLIPLCRTPCELPPERLQEGMSLIFTKDDYRSQTVVFSKATGKELSVVMKKLPPVSKPQKQARPARVQRLAHAKK